MRSPNSIRFLGLLCALLLVGCATPYQRSGLTGGFGEKKISESAYWVYFSGNGYASRDRVANFWLYRCAELTAQSGFQYMFLRPGENAPVGLLDGPGIMPAADVSRPNPMPRTNPAVYHPDDHSHLIAVRGGGGGGYTTTYVPGGTVTTWNSKGTVLMYHAPLPDELVWALDAPKILVLLGPYVTSDGSTPAPDWNTLYKSAMVAHEQITFAADTFPVNGESASLPSQSPQNAKPGSQISVAGKLRGENEIRSQFEAHSVPFHALFRDRKRLEHRDEGGSVVLSFTITPNGNVTKCRVASTTFTGSQLPEAVATLACKITFPPQSVDSTVVPSFPIKFVPLDKGEGKGTGT